MGWADTEQEPPLVQLIAKVTEAMVAVCEAASSSSVTVALTLTLPE